MELKPCPFCGGRPKLMSGPQGMYRYLECRKCGASTKWYLQASKWLYKAWNTRTGEQE